ncbi:MAG: PAS domain S-box protein [Elainellaceae cyanobacterium]
MHSPSPVDNWLFQLAFDNAAIGIAMVMPDGRWRRVNAALCNIVGYTAEELYQLTFQDITHPKDLAIDLDYVRQTLAGERQGYQMEKRYIHKRGHMIWVQLNVSLARDADGAPIYFVSQIQDISDRKRLEKEIRQRERRLNAFFGAASSTGVGFCIYDEKRRYLQINQALADVGEAAIETCVGKTTADVLPTLAETIEPLLIQVQTSRKPILNAEITGESPQHPGKTMTWLASYFPIRTSPSQTQVGMIIFDISSRKQMEFTLKGINQELARSNQELENFAYVASHDLQEPLRKIQAFGDRLQIKYSQVLDERGSDYLRRMRNASERMQTLIRDLLRFSRITTKTLPYKFVNLNQVVVGVLSDLEAATVEINAQILVGPLPAVYADSLQMRQLFQNLIANSLKFHYPDRPPKIEVSQLPSESLDQVRIAIADNGIGFDEKYRSQIFDPFQRLHGRLDYPGTGMGLAICRKIAEYHSGNITAHSVPNEGTTMVVTLPTHSTDDPAL